MKFSELNNIKKNDILILQGERVKVISRYCRRSTQYAFLVVKFKHISDNYERKYWYTAEFDLDGNIVNDFNVAFDKAHDTR